MVSKVHGETMKETQTKPARTQCVAPGRRIRSDGWSELDYLDYTIRKHSDR